jgi:lipoprotein-anchoring transpeptidase ErfK/SrfK
MKKTPPEGPSHLAATVRYRFATQGHARFRASFPVIVLLLFCGGLLFAFFFFSSSPVNAAIFATLTATEENPWAFVDVAKPTYTHVPAFTPTSIPTIAPTVTEASGVMDMQVLADTAVPTRGAPVLVQNPAGNSGGKYILVDISEQHMYVYEGDTMIYSFVASTGINNATRAGTFAVQSKIPNAYGSTWNIWMPNWLGIYWSGGLENGIHALPILPSGATLWEGYLGRPISYGCVVLGTYESSLLYDWAEIGTTVEIRW